MDLEQVALKLQETTDRSVRNEGRIKKLESEHEVLHQLATSVAVLAEQMKTLNGSVDTLNSKVDEMESKPGKAAGRVWSHKLPVCRSGCFCCLAICRGPGM